MNPNQQFTPQQPLQTPQMPPQQTSPQENPGNVYQPQQAGLQPQSLQAPPRPRPFSEQQVMPLERRPKKWIILPVILLGLAVLGVGAYMLFGRSSLPKTDMAAVNSVSNSPAAADVAALDKTEAFWAYFKNAAEQQKLVITKVEAGIPAGQDPAAARYYYMKTGIDYATKKFTVAKEEQLNGEVEAQLRCYDGKSFIPRGSVESWTTIDSSDPLAECNVDVRPDKFNDGVNAGGLSSKQSQAFIGTLRAQEGLMTVRDLQLVQHKGKPYLHFTVQLTPAPGPSGMIKFGGGWLMMAFRKTGLDAATHPYAHAASDSRGFRLEYYVDPVTKLPAYSEVLFDKVDEKATGAHVYKNHYQFGTDTFDAKTTNHDPITFDW